MKLKIWITSFLLKRVKKQIEVYGLFEDLYNFTKPQADSKSKFMMLWVIFYQILRYERKIEKNLNYIERILK